MQTPQTKQAGHTPLRYSTIQLHNPERSLLIRDDGSGAAIARIEWLEEDEPAELTASRILKAVNSHQELLGALQDLEYAFGCTSTIDGENMKREALLKARDLITKHAHATGE